MPDLSTFTIYWLDAGWAGENAPKPRTIGRDTVRRHDLTAAISAASYMLRNGRGNSSDAVGFVVRVNR